MGQKEIGGGAGGYTHASPVPLAAPSAATRARLVRRVLLPASASAAGVLEGALERVLLVELAKRVAEAREAFTQHGLCSAVS